jgi:hypothetical protein
MVMANFEALSRHTSGGAGETTKNLRTPGLCIKIQTDNSHNAKEC